MHRAVTKDGSQVAMKIQYPGVADSIESDIENVRRLLNYTNLIPKGLFLDRAVKVLLTKQIHSVSSFLITYSESREEKTAKWESPFENFDNVHYKLPSFLQVAKEELARECDYEIEAESQKLFRDLLSETPGFYVPRVVDEVSSKKVLTTELISGNFSSRFTLFW